MSRSRALSLRRLSLSMTASILSMPANVLVNAPEPHEVVTGTVARICMGTTFEQARCAGTAIAETRILTARHCVTELEPYSVKAPNGKCIKVKAYAGSEKADIAV